MAANPLEPHVTVLMAVFNEIRFLPDAIDSVLSQSLADFELLVIDDGSTDGSGKYLDSISDPRVRVVHHAANRGLVSSLNEGLELARGRYIARMDGDDIARPDRLARQATFLGAHDVIGIVGSARRLVDEAGDEIGVAHPAETDVQIRFKCLLGNPFAHPSVMFRRELFIRHSLRYADSYRSEDYDLWTRLLRLTRGQNLPEPLITYRVRPAANRVDLPRQLEAHDRVAHRACRTFLPDFRISLEEIRQLRGRYGGFSVRDPLMNPNDPRWIERLRHLLRAFCHAHRDESGVDALWIDQDRKIDLFASARAA